MRAPDRYHLLTDFKNPQQRFGLGEPIELMPSRGDVLFFHYLLVHSGSLNTSNKPRFALRLMCACETCRMWEKHGKWNVWMPCPDFIMAFKNLLLVHVDNVKRGVNTDIGARIE